MKIIIILIILSLSIFSQTRSIEEKASENFNKKPSKIIFERNDGSTFEKMKGGKEWKEVIPAQRKNDFIENSKVDEFKKIVLTKPNGKTYYSYNLKDWYPESSEGAAESAHNTNKLTNFEIIPNPAQNQTNISFVLKEQTHVIVSLYTIEGFKVKEFISQKAEKGKFVLPINVSNTNNGNYILQIIVDNQIYSENLIVEN